MTDFFKSAFGLFGQSQSAPPSSQNANSSHQANNNNNNRNSSGQTNDFVGQIIVVGNLKLKVTKMLAEGGFAIVYVVVDLATGVEYALKVNFKKKTALF